MWIANLAPPPPRPPTPAGPPTPARPPTPDPASCRRRWPRVWSGGGASTSGTGRWPRTARATATTRGWCGGAEFSQGGSAAARSIYAATAIWPAWRIPAMAAWTSRRATSRSAPGSAPGRPGPCSPTPARHPPDPLQGRGGPRRRARGLRAAHLPGRRRLLRVDRPAGPDRRLRDRGPATAAGTTSSAARPPAR
jgi:hypothetical protein